MVNQATAAQLYAQEIEQLEQWWSEPRWRQTKRRYAPHDIVSMRGTLQQQYLSDDMARKFYGILEQRFASRQASTTYGCLDPVMACQMAKHLDTIYVSVKPPPIVFSAQQLTFLPQGWQSAAMASASDEPGADYADYPYTTIPNKVNQLFKAQQFHDRKQRNAQLSRAPAERFTHSGDDIDYFAPLIADADTGHGGLSATMKLTKLFIENGAACIHIEDQATGLKGGPGAILIPTCDHIDKLVACRAQADICGVGLVLMCRTDSLRATCITSVVDDRDHAFVLGVTNPDAPSWVTYVKSARRDGRSETLQELEQQWIALARVKTFDDAVTDAIHASAAPQRRSELIKQYHTEVQKLISLDSRRDLARSLLNQDVFFDWDQARHEKGYYRYRGGVACTVARAISYSPYSDIVWPVFDPASDIDAARAIAKGLHAVSPEAKLAANLPTPFAWAKNKTRADIESFSAALAECGFCWQHMTLGGIHLAALAADEFSKAFKTNPIAAYVDLIQQKGIGDGQVRGVSTLDSWKWAGGDYGHNMMELLKET